MSQSPAPVSPCSRRDSPPKHGHNGYSLSPSMFPPAECMCATCQYYKAAYLYHQECHSPNMDAYTMYPFQFYPSMGMATSEMSVGPVESEPPTSLPVAEQFQRCVGHLAKTACTSSGRSMLQSVMRLQHLDKIQAIFDEVTHEAEAVMLDAHGCHVVRSLIEVLDDHQIEKLVSLLTPTLILNMCTLSQYTRRILQTLFEQHKSTQLQTIVDILANNAQYLAATQQGCISWMRVFEHCSAEQKAQLLTPLFPTFVDLACDPFGNYVVQCALEHSDPSTVSKYILERFAGKLLKLACNKFASNVMEKVVLISTPAVRRVVLDELIFNPAALQQMVHDGFGNFVIQSIIESSTNTGELKKVCDRLRPVIPHSPYGHKIEAKMRGKRFPLQQMPANQFRRHSTPQAAF